MNSEWKDFLISQGAELAADSGVTFSDPAAEDCALFDLSHLGLMAVEGADADKFLQGQLTNDVRELTEQHSQLSSHCSAKGRILASFRMIRRAGVIYMQLPEENLPGMLKRLNMFKLRSQVTLEDVSNKLIRMGVAGQCATDLLEKTLGSTAKLENGVSHHDELTLVHMPGATPRFEILGPTGKIIALWKTLAAAGAVPANAERWALEDIRAGVPTVFGLTTESFIPQMINMQLVDGVSFTKGCYTGQEIVARMQYLGKLKRRMYRAEIEAEQRPLPGSELFSGASASGQGAGRVVDARSIGENRYELLAVVEIAAADSGEVHLGEDGPALRFLKLPYALPDVESALAH